MREIKFRFWDNIVKDFTGNRYMVGDEGFNIFDKIIPQQFTGLKDKNGKDIYEGDIVKHRYLNNVSTIEVVFYQGSFNLDAQNSNCSFEIIGNIFENPKLL